MRGGGLRHTPRGRTITTQPCSKGHHATYKGGKGAGVPPTCTWCRCRTGASACTCTCAQWPQHVRGAGQGEGKKPRRWLSTIRTCGDPRLLQWLSTIRTCGTRPHLGLVTAIRCVHDGLQFPQFPQSIMNTAYGRYEAKVRSVATGPDGGKPSKKPRITTGPDGGKPSSRLLALPADPGRGPATPTGACSL